MMFTTYDRDNDRLTRGYTEYNSNCATLRGGGFWYNSCGDISLNTVGRSNRHFKWRSIDLQTSRMWLTC